ncbi:UDP-N-acetylmuramoyl-L-alanine--D-glutamate ligase [Synoicihabitans lomoniglobus]|uniref:UDP-N-acetylmuramoylalanine--D-glutamate ligase n=1 Tax=Synoicihabitans lomoniglobus TaxID=2909285 RepID=A0AAF0CQF6_9BACT|nr:UDP-N-acetylmuramoyl-L-alanine--D-glutamate ligase [Opitutaceae bacterium LMO-M01]WED66154.1 UDP-N-acetylmuramoyl-L-alanine--D-glutamate ligase [Opitutaceae bacterium LMO-M01]
MISAPVAVLGAGVSGRAAANLVAHLGGTAVIYDEQGTGEIRSNFRPGDHRMVIVSPGFAPRHAWVVEARSAGLVCLAEVDFASLFWRGAVVAITGTNGKTTLTELLTYALNAAGVDAWSVGNIGAAFSQIVVDRDGGAPDSIAVCEISSFQAEMLRHFRADAAIWTNFAEDHLERHGSMQAYFEAKWRLFERAVGGEVFAGSSVQRAAARFGQSLPDSAVIDTEDPAGDVLLRGTVFEDQPQRENFLLAAAWWRAAGLREPVLYAAAQSFTIGPHRLANVAENAGVTWWNDSKATNFHAVEAALTKFGSQVILIAGGRAKGGDMAGFVERISPRIKQVLLIGETRNILATFLGAAAVPHRVCVDLADAVNAAANLATAGDHVLLSPGFSSLDAFRGYADRGQQFETLVRALAAADPVSL